MHLHQHIPCSSEGQVVKPIIHVTTKGSPEFKTSFTTNKTPGIVYKHEVDRTCSHLLNEALDRLQSLVQAKWNLNLRVTATWDPSGHGHHPGSTHYEGRAADMTIEDRDESKLGDLADLAVQAGFGWSFYEDDLHVHASVPRSW